MSVFRCRRFLSTTPRSNPSQLQKSWVEEPCNIVSALPSVGVDRSKFIIELENESSESADINVLFLMPLTHLPRTFDKICFWLPLLSSEDRKAVTSLCLLPYLPLPILGGSSISASSKPMVSSLCLLKYVGLSLRCDFVRLDARFARCIFQVLRMMVAASCLSAMNLRRLRIMTPQALLRSLHSRRIPTKSPASSLLVESSSQIVMAIPWLNSPVTAVN